MFPGLAASAAGYTADAAMGEVIDENVLDNHCRVASDDHQRDAASACRFTPDLQSVCPFSALMIWPVNERDVSSREMVSAISSGVEMR